MDALDLKVSTTYENKFSLNIEQGNDSPNAALNGYASLGYKYGTLNGSLASKEFAIVYKDTNRSEIFTNIDRNTYNIAYTNAKNIDMEIMKEIAFAKTTENNLGFSLTSIICSK